MAIETGGYQVGVMPQYNPVQPSLASFNPLDITKGLMDSIQMTGNVEQLKAFRQHAAEVAATEGVRTQLLKAQADQAKLKLESDLAIHESGVKKQIALNKLLANTAPGKEKADNATNEATAATAPLQVDATNAKSRGILRQDRIGRATIEQDVANAQMAAQNAPIKMALEAERALADYDDLLQNGALDRIGSRRLLEAEARYDNARAAEAEAKAAVLRDGQLPQNQKTAALREAARTMLDIAKTQMPDPRVKGDPAGNQATPTISVLDYLHNTRDENGEVFKATVTPYFSGGSDRPAAILSETGEELLKQYYSAKDRLSELRGESPRKKTVLPPGWTISP